MLHRRLLVRLSEISVFGKMSIVLTIFLLGVASNISTGSPSQNSVPTFETAVIDLKETAPQPTETTSNLAPPPQLAPTPRVATVSVKSTPQNAPPQVGSRCPHGTYIDASDNELCRPFENFHIPEGAIAAAALCKDGTYSFIRHHANSCADHGGVASWL